MVSIPRPSYPLKFPPPDIILGVRISTYKCGVEGEQTFIYEREEGWKTIRPVSSISTANSSIRIKVRADQGGSEVNGSVH